MTTLGDILDPNLWVSYLGRQRRPYLNGFWLSLVDINPIRLDAPASYKLHETYETQRVKFTQPDSRLLVVVVIDG